MQDHHWNKKIRIKHEDFVIFSSTDCQVLHYFHMHCAQQPHVGFHQQLQKVNFYVKIELSSNMSVTSMHINYTIQGCALGKFSGRLTMTSRSPSLPGWSPERVALYTSYISRESAELPNSFIFNLSHSIFTSPGMGSEASYYIYQSRTLFWWTCDIMKSCYKLTTYMLKPLRKFLWRPLK